MKIYRYFAVALIACLACLTSCIDDASKRAQIPLLDVTIQGNDQITFKLLEESVYTPVIDFAGSKPEDYDYVWTIGGIDEICNTMELHYSFNKVGEQYLTFKMTDKSTGVAYAQDYKITVTSSYNLGWLILSEDSSERSALSFIETDTYTFTPDLYAKLHPEDQLGTKPYRIFFDATNKGTATAVFQEGGDGCLYLDGNDFKKIGSLKNDMFLGSYPQEEGGFYPMMEVFTHRGINFLISKNGKMYVRNGNTSYDLFYCSYPDEPYVNANIPDAVYTAVNEKNNTKGRVQLLWDDYNKRWTCYGAAWTATTDATVFKAGTDFKSYTGLDIYVNGLAKNPETANAQHVISSTYADAAGAFNQFTIIELNGKYYALTCVNTQTTSYVCTITKAEQKELPSTINSNTKFHMMHRSLQAVAGDYFSATPYLLYTNGHKLYLWHYQTGLEYLVEDFDLIENHPNGDVLSIVQNGLATQVAVTFTDGHVVILNVDRPTMDMIRQSNIQPNDPSLLLAHITGIPGKPVDVMFKYGSKYNNYVNDKEDK